MKKARFTESQIINILKLSDSGIKVDEICRQNGISNATYYNWKSKYGGMNRLILKGLKNLRMKIPGLSGCLRKSVRKIML